MAGRAAVLSEEGMEEGHPCVPTGHTGTYEYAGKTMQMKAHKVTIAMFIVGACAAGEMMSNLMSNLTKSATMATALSPRTLSPSQFSYTLTWRCLHPRSSAGRPLPGDVRESGAERAEAPGRVRCTPAAVHLQRRLGWAPRAQGLLHFILLLGPCHRCR